MKFEWLPGRHSSLCLGYVDGLLSVWINPDNTYEFYSTAKFNWVVKGPLPSGLSMEEQQAYVETVWRLTA